jgi:hypothetical protein
MIYAIIAVLIYAIWLYKRSNSAFFQKTKETLNTKWGLLIDILYDRGFTYEEVKSFNLAYYFFTENPNAFDGATIVADFDTINGLDASAMLHDYRYLKLRNKGFWSYLKGKLKADVEFGKNMRKLGITWLNAWFRVTLLIISTIIWMPIVALTGKTKTIK